MKLPGTFWLMRIGVPGLLVVVCGAWGQTSKPLSFSAGHAIALYEKGDFHAACPMFHDLTVRASDPAPHLYLLGCAIHASKVAEIQKELGILTRLTPKGASAYSVAGGWLATAGYCSEAGQAFAAASAPPEPGTFEFGLAQCHQERGDVPRALDQFRKAVALNPDKEEYALSLSFLLTAIGNSDEAGKVLVDAVKRHPQSVRILTAMSLLHLELGYPDRARMGYEKVRAIDPESPMVWKLLGRIQNGEGHYEDAVKSFDEAATRDPRDAQIPLFRGLALARIDGRADQALADFLRAQQLDPALTEAGFQAATIYFQVKEDYANAARLLEKVVAATPGHARARQLLVQSYYRLGEKEKAMAEQQKLRELSPEGK
ncbi:MAG: tetratricopeptide repeat protein [Bryobacteraceae bacterium]